MNDRISKCYATFKKSYMIFFVAFFLTAFAVLFLRNTIPAPDKAHSVFKYILAAYFFLGAATVVFTIKKTQKMHIIFLVLTTVLGILYFVAVPLGQVADETVHFCRIFEISEGCFFTPVTDNQIGNELPKYIIQKYPDYDAIIELFQTARLDDASRKFLAFPTAALYLPLVYIPQAIGTFLFRLFTDNAAVVLYGARLFNFLTGTAIFYFAIKLIPYGKIVVVTIALLPMVMHQSISASADVLTNALAAFSVAYALYLAQGTAPLKKRQLVLLASVLLLLSMCKIVYFLFTLLVIILSNSRFGSKKAAIAYKICIPTAAVLLNVIWFLYTTRYFCGTKADVDIMGQISFVLTHPLQYVNVLVRTIADSTQRYLETMTGSYLGWLDVPCNYLGFGLAFLVLVTVLLGYSQNRYSNKAKTTIFFVFAGTVLLIFSALYAQWTPVGNDVVKGVQGRYFIPLLLPLSCFIPQIAPNQEGDAVFCYENSGRYMVYLLMLFSNYITVVNVFTHFLK